MSFLVKFSHKTFPLFNRFSTFDRNVKSLESKPGSRKFLSCLPLAKYLDFYDVSKNSEHINTFREARLKSHPPKFRSLTFQKQKESQRPKRKSFHTFFHNGERNLLPKSHREKDNLIINSFKPFKDTISKMNTCFRQHHDSKPKYFKKSW